jgi:4-amino-4-deoxy-L-arabinose transferase-like glycosyltransferase
MKRALMIAVVLFVVVGAYALYWTNDTSENAIVSAVGFFVLFFGIFATGGIHRVHDFFPLFAISWIADSLVTICIVEAIVKVGARKKN